MSLYVVYICYYPCVVKLNRDSILMHNTAIYNAVCMQEKKRGDRVGRKRILITMEQDEELAVTMEQDEELQYIYCCFLDICAYPLKFTV